MEDLRALYESLGLEEVRTHINSGNVLFRTAERDLTRLCKRIEDAIEGACGFRSNVILRTPADLKRAMARNPFAERADVEPHKVAIHFLAAAPSAAALEQMRAIEIEPEELHIHGRELYIYYALGMARPKLKLPQVEKALRTTGTSRNLNTVRKLLEMAG
jgi:uncharacterized protein (DUF1697 family)